MDKMKTKFGFKLEAVDKKCEARVGRVTTARGEKGPAHLFLKEALDDTLDDN